MPYRVRAHYEGSITKTETFLTNGTEANRLRHKLVRDEGAYYAVVVDLVTGEEFGEGIKPYEIITLVTETGSEYVLDQSTMTWTFFSETEYSAPESRHGKMVTLPIVEIGEPVIILCPPIESRADVSVIRTARVIRIERAYKRREVRASRPPSRVCYFKRKASVGIVPRPPVLHPYRTKTPAQVKK